MEEIIELIEKWQKKYFQSVSFKIWDSGEILVKDYSGMPRGHFDSIEDLRNHLNE